MDVTLHFVERGQGTPLVLLHGNGEDHSYFEHQIGHFCAGHRVVAVDTRGHGASPRGDAPFTIRQFAEDLCGLLDGLSIGKADILGFSDGGNIALCFALKYPQRVGRLILNGANLSPAGVKASVQTPILLGYWAASLAAKRSFAARRNAELLGLMVNDPNIEPASLAALTMPVLVIAGTRDMIRESHTRLIFESLPNAELVLLEGDHFVAKREPAAFNAAVRRFLEVSDASL